MIEFSIVDWQSAPIMSWRHSIDFVRHGRAVLVKTFALIYIFLLPFALSYHTATDGVHSSYSFNTNTELLHRFRQHRFQGTGTSSFPPNRTETT